MRMEQMYQEVILDHYKHPHGRGLREPFGAEVHHVNPTCGDEVTLRVQLADDGTVVDVSYDGQGCSISQASTSVLTDQVVGMPVEQALQTVAAFNEMVSSRGTVEGDEDAVVQRVDDRVVDERDSAVPTEDGEPARIGGQAS